MHEVRWLSSPHLLFSSQAEQAAVGVSSLGPWRGWSCGPASLWQHPPPKGRHQMHLRRPQPNDKNTENPRSAGMQRRVVFPTTSNFDRGVARRRHPRAAAVLRRANSQAPDRGAGLRFSYTLRHTFHGNDRLIPVRGRAVVAGLELDRSDCDLGLGWSGWWRVTERGGGRRAVDLTRFGGHLKKP